MDVERFSLWKVVWDDSGKGKRIEPAFSGAKSVSIVEQGDDYRRFVLRMKLEPEGMLRLDGDGGSKKQAYQRMIASIFLDRGRIRWIGHDWNRVAQRALLAILSCHRKHGPASYAADISGDWNDFFLMASGERDAPTPKDYRSELPYAVDSEKVSIYKLSGTPIFVTDSNSDSICYRDDCVTVKSGGNIVFCEVLDEYQFVDIFRQMAFALMMDKTHVDILGHLWNRQSQLALFVCLSDADDSDDTEAQLDLTADWSSLVSDPPSRCKTILESVLGYC